MADNTILQQISSLLMKLYCRLYILLSSKRTINFKGCNLQTVSILVYRDDQRQFPHFIELHQMHKKCTVEDKQVYPISRYVHVFAFSFAQDTVHLKEQLIYKSKCQ